MPDHQHAVVETRGEIVTLIGLYPTADEASARADELQDGAEGATYTALPARVWAGRVACG
jgi:hypothetical protein